MSDEKSSPIQDVLNELRDPWDWTAAFVGAAGGAAVTIIAHGADLGHSIPTGALTAIGARRAILSSFSRKRLRNRAHGLLEILKAEKDVNAKLVVELEDYTNKWEKKIIASDLLEKKIAQIAEMDTQRKVRMAATVSPEPSPVVGRKIDFDE